MLSEAYHHHQEQAAETRRGELRIGVVDGISSGPHDGVAAQPLQAESCRFPMAIALLVATARGGRAEPAGSVARSLPPK